VLDAKTGDAFGKSTLMVAMLRLVNIPARMRFVQLHGDVARGLAQGLQTITHPVVECWVDDRWLKTDTHIYDIHYLAAAREKLNAAGWTVGYGIHRNAHSVWDGRDNVFAGFSPDRPDGQPLRELGVFDDPRRFNRAMRIGAGPITWLNHKLCDFRWAMSARTMRRSLRQLRDEINQSLVTPSSEPIRIAS
jgi:transglutaminase-like putative cysteine protease